MNQNTFKDITVEQRSEYNAVVSHPLQSFEWGEFRKKTGLDIVRRGEYQEEQLLNGLTITIHQIPRTPWNIGYLPKGYLPDKELLQELLTLGKQYNCVYIQLEPNVIKTQNSQQQITNLGLVPSFHPLFTRYTFVLDLTKTEDELLANLHPKTRYNIRVAMRHGVNITEDNSEKAFERYWQLTQETTNRQKFYAHTKHYHKLQWETFSHEHDQKKLTSHLLTAIYNGNILTTHLLFVFHDTLYYPYGASSNEDRKVMHSTLSMWEAVRFGKRLGLSKFDMWGALGSEADPNDPWQGFHRFKQGFSPTLTEFVGSYDFVINPVTYQIVKKADKLRWFYLRLKKH